MPTYRVTEVTDIEADSQEEAIEKVVGNLGGEVVIQDAEMFGLERGPEGTGCPKCGNDEHIIVTASAVGMVGLGISGTHVDEIEWGALEDIDIIDASAFNCRACGYFEEVDGDKGLFEALNLDWG